MKFRNFLITLAFTLIPTKIFAQTVPDPNLVNAQANLNNWDYSLGRATTNGQTAIFTVLGDIIDRLPFYLTALAFFAFLYSSGMYIFAFGDTTKQEAAKKNMTWTAIGMIAMALVSIIIKFASAIGTATGHFTGTNGVPNVNGLTQ